MKTQKLIPIAAAALGFALAWILKPGGTVNVHTVDTEQGDSKPGPRDDTSKPRPRAVTEKRLREVKPGDFPLADLADQGPKTKSEAKMLRLTEALGLSVDQQGRIISAIENAKNPDENAAPLQDMATRGKAIEEALAKILNPEQLAKFQELRERERDNRIEARTQRTLNQFIEQVDLSPGERDEVIARLRQYMKEQIQAVPASAALLLDTSMLPTDEFGITLDGVLTLASLGDDPPDPNDPMGTHQKVLIRQREELERLLSCFDGVLTPAQMGQIHASIAEKRAMLEKLKQLNSQTPPPTPPTPPAPEQRTVIGPSPEDDVEEP